jgi:diacylglycerol kinase family enzyme
VLEKGEHLKLPFVQYEQVAKVIIRTPQRVHAHIDGEYLFTDYFEVACLPKRILFIV